MATTAKAAAVESVVDPAVAEATAVAEKAAEPIIEREFEVLRNFASHVATQLLSFAKGDVIGSHPGEALYAAGAPVKPLA